MMPNIFPTTPFMMGNDWIHHNIYKDVIYELTPVHCDKCGVMTLDRLWRWNDIKLKSEIRCLDCDK